MIKKNKEQPIIKRLVSSWKFWILIFTLILLVCFGIVQNIVNNIQPSEEWSLGIEVLKDGPDDYRKISMARRPDGNGVAVAYPGDEGVRFHELDWYGNIERSLDLEIDVPEIRVLNLGVEEDTYYIYVSDRKALNRLDLDISNLTLKGQKNISNTSEQFAAIGNIAIVGDDNITEIIVDEKVVTTFKDYDDLKRVSINREGSKIYATYDTVHGGNLVIIDGDNVTEEKLTSSLEQGTYGYLMETHINNDLVTVISHAYDLIEDKPSAFGVWQYGKDALEKKSFIIWHHGRTFLPPKIISVSGQQISYLLGTQQSSKQSIERIMRFPVTQSGQYTNISQYTRDKGQLIGLTRLSATRQYPIGYEYFESNKGSVVIWADREGKNSKLLLAGKGESWINYAKKVSDIQYVDIIQEIIFGYGSTLTWGLILFLLDVWLYGLYLLGFALLAFAYNKFVPINKDKKMKHILVGIFILVIGLKLYLSAIGNSGLKPYVNIYPMIFGNDYLLGAASLITSIFSIIMYRLWYNDNGHVGEIAQVTVFIGFEVYFYLLTVMMYLVSAMIKTTSML